MDILDMCVRVCVCVCVCVFTFIYIYTHTFKPMRYMHAGERVRADGRDAGNDPRPNPGMCVCVLMYVCLHT